MTRLICILLTLLFSLSGPAMGKFSDFGQSSLAAKIEQGYLPANFPRPNNAVTRALEHSQPAVWVSQGQPTRWNRVWSGMVGSRGQASVTFEVPSSSVLRPDGLLKGWFGKSQRVIEGDVPIPPNATVRYPN